ncbi:serine hydrolase domain-containing protein [Streptomyces sp. NPDC006879]|uniref:serine hydrolase domain-containing protein n=1 Tax=Streptomyces sp. NPDC006879 TaxID=3364767 RepID=UPI0036958762
MRRITLSFLCAAALAAIGVQAATPAGALTGAGSFAADSLHARPCGASPRGGWGPAAGQRAQILRIAEQAKKELRLKSVLLRVTVDGREVATEALGESMTGVPATPRMHFRSGSVAIAYMANLLLQLVDEGRVGLDDPIARWFPDLPAADKVTLRMLGSSTSGYADYVTDPEFLAALDAAPFRQWTARELVDISLSHPLWYAPGTNWSYSHANFVLLGAALEKITRTPLAELMEQRLLRPLGLRNSRSSRTPQIPRPVLHAFTDERGTYEESTFWNPSWTTAPGAVMTTDICDLARSAVAVGKGELLSRKSYATMLDPGTVGLGGPTADCPPEVCHHNTEAVHYGLGIKVNNAWVVQNPSFSGYAAAQGYLPSERVAIAVATTTLPDAAAGNTAEALMGRIADYLVPDQPRPVG